MNEELGMPAPAEYKTVQTRIRAYAQELGWSHVPGGEAEQWRDFVRSPE